MRGDHTGDVLGRCGERGTILQQVSPHRKHPSLKFHPPTNGVNLTFRLSRSRAHARSPAGPHILSLTRPSRLRGDSAPRSLSLVSSLFITRPVGCAVYGTARHGAPLSPRSSSPLQNTAPYRHTESVTRTRWSGKRKARHAGRAPGSLRQGARALGAELASSPLPFSLRAAAAAAAAAAALPPHLASAGRVLLIHSMSCSASTGVLTRSR